MAIEVGASKGVEVDGVRGARTFGDTVVDVEGVVIGLVDGGESESGM